MAFPLDRTQLLNHLRTSYLSLGDESEYFKTIIAPNYPGDGFKKGGTFNGNLQHSPPITFEIGHNVKRAIDNSTQRRKPPNQDQSKKKNRVNRSSSVKSQIRSYDSISPGASLEKQSMDSFISSHIDTSSDKDPIELQQVRERISGHPHFAGLHSRNTKKKTKSKSKLPIVKFFKSGKNEVSDSDSSDDERRRASVVTYGSSQLSSSKEDLTDKEGSVNVEDTSSMHSFERTQLTGSSREMSLSDQGHDSVSSLGQNGKSSEVTTDYEDEGEEDHGFESDAELSDDSEFTDLDNDTIMESFSRSDSITNALDKSMPNKDSVGGSQFGLNRKKRANTYGDHTVPKNLGANYLNSQPVGSNLMQVRSFGNLVELEKPSLSFQKIDPKVLHPHLDSNLSTMIHSKFKSANVNPLNYFLFVDGSLSVNSSRATQLNVFLPPKTSPVLKNLSIDRGVSISDCIGFILLNLLKLPEVGELNDPSFLNPNFWRLELVDEDGENYGSFGVLNRNRTFSSYNDPKDLAICRVKDVAEIDKNETMSPLPIEFKQNLTAFEQKKRSIDPDSDDTPKVDLLVNVYEYDNSGIPQKVPFKAPRSYTMGQVLKEFCIQRGLITTEYRFKVVEDRSMNSRFVKDVEVCGNLHSTVLELVPSDTKFNLIIDPEEKKKQMAPTPENFPSNLTAPNITPYNNELSTKVEGMTLESGVEVATESKSEHSKNKQSLKLKGKKEAKANKYLDDIIQGNNPQLPTNINSIYFKWKVLKNNSKMKKMKIKTFTEKNFIIDGDYIHITPPDDIMLNMGESVAHNQPLNFNQHHHNLNQQLNRVSNKQSSKTYSFHITQIMKVKQYSKHPNHFRIIVQRQQDGESEANSKDPMKKFYLVSESEAECSEIISKLKWVLQAYKLSSGVI